MKKSALLCFLIFAIGFSLVSCGGSASNAATKPVSGLTARVFASQSISGVTSAAGLVVINGINDTVPRGSVISAGTSPGLMALTPDRSTLMVYDSVANAIQVVNATKQTSAGSIQLPGPTGSPVTSMIALNTGTGYVPVPAATINGAPPGAIVVLNLATGGISSTISVPNAQTVVASPNGSQLLVFGNDTDVITVLYPLLVNTGVAVTATVTTCSGCRPVYAVFSSDGSTSYILFCGAECGGTQASVQTLDMATLALGTSVPVDGATIALLSGSTLYVAGNSPTSFACTGETTAATNCGRLDTVNLDSMTVTNRAVITDGYHDRIDISSNLQLFVGSYGCTTVGNVNNQQGEVRGCLSIFNATNGEVVIPPDSGDVTGLQSFTSRLVEYVVEGGNLRVYDTTQDKLLINEYITFGTIVIVGQVIDVKAVDFF